MVLNNDVKPHKAIDKKETNIHKANAYLEVGEDPAKSHLYATNGRILVDLLVDGTGDISGPLSYESLEACTKQRPLQALVASKESAQVINGPSFRRPDINKQIQYEAVLNALPKDGFTVTLDADLLGRLGEALGNNVVTLTFAPQYPLKAIKVETKNGIGALMPVQLEKAAI